RGLLTRRQEASQPRKGVLAEQIRIPAPELSKNLDHLVGVPQLRQRTAHRANLLATPVQSAACVRVDELQDRTDLLDAFARLMNRRFARRSGTQQLNASGAKLFRCKPSKSFCRRSEERRVGKGRRVKVSAAETNY